MITEPSLRSGGDENGPALGAGSTLQDRYRILRQLGAGGMGAVYEAVDQRLDATVAIKQTFSADERLRRQFEQEARLLAQLNHPSLPRVSDYFIEDGRAFLVMQFISGDDLAREISRQAAPFPRQQVIAWADQLLDALIYLHTRDRQIIHRDIKPHNLKLTEAGQIALLDFGLAKTHSADHSNSQSSSSIFGYTKRYSPLEQIQDQGTSPQSDIYALGATLYHLFTGAKPPDCLVRANEIAKSNPDPLRPAHELHAAVGADLSEILNRAMAIDVGDRFASASEFREALRRLGRQFEIRSAIDKRAASESVTRNRVARQTTRPDPFDSYSILKPEQEVFRMPRPNHRPAVFAVTLAVVLLTISASFPSGVFSLALRWLGSQSPNMSRETLSVTTLSKNRNESEEVKPAAIRSGLTSQLAEARQVEKNRRRDRRNASKPAPAKPPKIKLEP